MSERTDVLVIGAGVIGVCVAYYALREGRQVTILERDAVCSGSSYGNAGWLVPSHSVPLAAPGVIMQGLKWMFNSESPFYVKPRFDRDLFSWLWRFRAAANERAMRKSLPVIYELSRASLALYAELVTEENLACDYRQDGVLALFKNQRRLQEGFEEDRLLREQGLSTRTLDSAEVAEMEPAVRSDVAGGIFYSQDAHVNPREFVLGLAERVVERGGVIHTGAVVQGFETAGNRITSVKTTKGDYHAEQVVLAAGAWSPGLVRDLRLDLPVQAAKGYSVTFQSPDQLPALPLILAEASVGVTPMGPNLRLAGTLELSGLNLRIDSRRVGAILRAADEYLVADVGSMQGEVWCGMRPLSPDGKPIIGAVDPYSNLIVATGHSMTGMTLSPVTGKLVSQLLTGQTPVVDPAPMSPKRFQ